MSHWVEDLYAALKRGGVPVRAFDRKYLTDKEQDMLDALMYRNPPRWMIIYENDDVAMWWDGHWRWTLDPGEAAIYTTRLELNAALNDMPLKSGAHVKVITICDPPQAFVETPEEAP